ncbi:hypothetical protein ACWJJH_20495 [Endozoicomonadaceae bacterium StTr2]
MTKKILALLLVCCLPFFLGMKEAETNVPLKRWIVVFNETMIDCQQENMVQMAAAHFGSDQVRVIRLFQSCGLIVEAPDNGVAVDNLPPEFLYIEPDQRNSILVPAVAS